MLIHFPTEHLGHAHILFATFEKVCAIYSSQNEIVHHKLNTTINTKGCAMTCIFPLLIAHGWQLLCETFEAEASGKSPDCVIILDFLQLFF